MARYLFRVSYTADGAKGVLKEGGTGRRTMLEDLAKGLGGSIEAFYFSFGYDDVFTIVQFPDNVTAAAVGLAVAASGAASISTTVLLTPEEVDEASKKSVAYRAPGA